MSDSSPALLADIGGTNARFACVDLAGDLWLGEWTGAVRDYPDIYAAIRAAFAHIPEAQGARSSCIAIAGPVHGDRVAASNSPWVFSQTEMREHFAWDHLTVLNDFHAAAYGALNLTPEQFLAIGKAATSPMNAPAVVIGPGTGLGVAGLFPDQAGRWRAAATEGGHARLAPYSREELAVLDVLQRKLGNVQREDVLSGPGLCNLYGALTEVWGEQTEPVTDPAMITRRALEDGACRSARVLNCFCAILGSVAADVALDLGATSRVFLAGGILPRIQDFLIASPFRQRFEDHPQFSAWLEPVETVLIIEKRLGLLGAARRLQAEYESTRA
ncbi:glucokinase [Gilvimarinus sp. F26214L]|uniref:glucokinase n=1 Tax=Gilvimarinus sp. DZF01 TaxID=3461371 RepID=UPI0040458724